jgi:hypothetical protein
MGLALLAGGVLWRHLSFSRIYVITVGGLLLATSLMHSVKISGLNEPSFMQTSRAKRIKLKARLVCIKLVY